MESDSFIFIIIPLLDKNITPFIHPQYPISTEFSTILEILLPMKIKREEIYTYKTRDRFHPFKVEYESG